MEKMKRARLVSFKNFQIEEADIPEPKADEVLIKVCKCGICGSDISAYYGKHPYIPFDIVLGHEFSGYITKMGSNVTNLNLNDRVTVLPHLGCGHCKACLDEKYNLCNELIVIGCQTTGAYSEYITVPAKVTFKLPDEMSYEQGAFVEPASVGYHGAKRGVKEGDNVVVMGAGTIGQFALQASNVLGAKQTVIADFDKDRLLLAKSLGANDTIDLSEESLEKGIIRIFKDSRAVNCYIDCVGYSGAALTDIINVANRGSTVVSIGIISEDFEIPNIPDITEHELNILGSSMFWPEDFDDVIHLMSENQIRIDNLISHRYKIAELKDVFKMVDKKEEKHMKIMLDVNFD